MFTQVNVEDRTVVFTIIAIGTKSQPYYWELEGEGVHPSCFVNNTITGSGNITDGVNIDIVLKGDESVANLRKFKMVVRAGDENGIVLCTSPYVNVTIIRPEPIIQNCIGFYQSVESRGEIGEYEFDNFDSGIATDSDTLRLWMEEDIHPTYYNEDGTALTTPAPDSSVGHGWKHFNSITNNSFEDSDNFIESLDEFLNRFTNESEVNLTHELPFRIYRSDQPQNWLDEVFYFKTKFTVLAEILDIPTEEVEYFKSFKCEDYSFTALGTPRTYDDGIFETEFELFGHQNEDPENSHLGTLTYTPRSLVETGYNELEEFEYNINAGKALKVRMDVVRLEQPPLSESNEELEVITSVEFVLVNRMISYRVDGDEAPYTRYCQLNSLLNVRPSNFPYSIAHETCNPVQHGG